MFSGRRHGGPFSDRRYDGPFNEGVFMPFYPNSRHWGAFPLRPLVEEIVRRHSPRLTAQLIDTVIDIPADQMVVADRELLRRAVQNLVRSAVAVMPAGGALIVTSAADRNAVELEIADTGPPLSDEARRRAFDPAGTGRGGAAGHDLAVVRRIADLHGGNVFVANCPEGGVAFTLRIPRPVVLEAAA